MIGFIHHRSDKRELRVIAMKTWQKVLWAALIGQLPLQALATDKPKPPPQTVYVQQECKSCKRDRIGWFLAGVGVTVLFYESQKKDKTVALMPAAEGVAVKAEWRF